MNLGQDMQELIEDLAAMLEDVGANRKSARKGQGTRRIAMPKKKKRSGVAAWAWELEDGELCQWAEPSHKQLLYSRSKPSTDARVVRVRIIKSTDL